MSAWNAFPLLINATLIETGNNANAVSVANSKKSTKMAEEEVSVKHFSLFLFVLISNANT